MSEEQTPIEDNEINSIEEYHQRLEDNDGKGRLYWIQKNIRTKWWNWTKNNIVKSVISLVLVLFALFLLRANFQPLALGIRKYFVLVLLLMFLVWLIRKSLRKKKRIARYSGNLVLLGIVVLGFFYGPQVYRYLGLYYHYQTLNKIEINDLPLTEQERIHPLNSIQVRLNQDILTDVSEATLPHIVIRKDGGVDYTMCVGPSTEHLYQKFTKNMSEVISIPANTYNIDFKSVERENVNFDVGENLMLSAKARVAAIKQLGFFDYFNYEADEVKYIENEQGKWIQVMTLIKWKGFLIPRPVFGGVIVFDQLEKNSFGNWVSRVAFGKGTYISPDDIVNYNHLKNQNLQSDFITRFTAESFRFQNGFFAPMPGYHDKDVRIPNIDSDQNQQPYVTYFNFMDIIGDANAQGIYHYFGLEPYQEDKGVLSTSIFVPSNGDNVVYYFDHIKNTSGYSGTSTIRKKIVDSKKNYDWSTVYPAETRPFIKYVNGKKQFFWLSTIVTKVDKEGTKSFGGTNPELTITDASSNEVYWIKKQNLYKQNDTAWVSQIKTHELNNE